MNKKKNIAKKNFIMSFISLVVCVAMLIGTTFAWFTDSVSSGVNRIQAGNLDIEVDYSKNGTDWQTIEGTESLFSGDLWEPGHTEYVNLRIKNAGTLALKYKILVSPISENGGINVYNQSFKLSDYLVFGTTTLTPNNVTYADRNTARSAVGETTALNQNDLTKEGTLTPNSEHYTTLVIYMPENVDNHANAKPGTIAPSIDLGITVLATQVENELDSFGTDYDSGAFYVAGAYYDYFEAVNVSNTADQQGNFTVTKQDTNTGVIASASGRATAGSEVNLIVMKSSDAEKNFSGSVEDGHELNGYEIKVTGQEAGSLVQGSLYVGTGLENFKFYHNSQLMTEKHEVALGDGEYRYNSNDGYVYFATTTFSPFQATYLAPVAAIGTAVYGTLDGAITAANSGATITLLKDSVGKGIGSKDGSKVRDSLIIDFAGHTYTMLNPAVGSQGTETQAMHWGKSLDSITLKNGTFKVAENASDVAMAMQNYIDFTAENMTFDFTNISVQNYGTTGDFNPEDGRYKEYSGLEVPMFNNNSGKMILKNTTINMPSSSTKGISADGDGVDIILCTIYGAINLTDQNSGVRIKDSTVTKGVVTYFEDGNNVSTAIDGEGYTVYKIQKPVSTTEE